MVAHDLDLVGGDPAADAVLAVAPPFEDPPRLGSHLADRLPAVVEEIVMRTFAVVSGVVTGALTLALAPGTTAT